MPSSIDRYLDRLDAMLRGRATESALEELKSETRFHLEQAANRHRLGGRNDGDAEEQAILEFGPPKRLARQYLRENPAPQYRRSTRWAKGLALGIFGYPPLQLLIFDAMPFNVGLWPWFLGIAAFFVLAVRTRRSFVLPVTGIGLMVAVPLALLASRHFLLYDPQGGDDRRVYVRRSEARDFLSENDQRNRFIRANLPEIESALSKLSSSNSLEVLPSRFRPDGAVLVPVWRGWYAKQRIDWMASWDPAKSLSQWKGNGRQVANALRAERSRIEMTSPALRAALNSDSLPAFLPSLASTLIWVEVVLAALFSLNGLGCLLGLGLSRIAPRRRIRA